MVAILRLIIGPLVTALVEQIPTFVAAFQKWRARKNAGTTLTADQQKIADFVKDSEKGGAQP